MCAARTKRITREEKEQTFGRSGVSLVSVSVVCLIGFKIMVILNGRHVSCLPNLLEKMIYISMNYNMRCQFKWCVEGISRRHGVWRIYDGIGLSLIVEFLPRSLSLFPFWYIYKINFFTFPSKPLQAITVIT